MISKINWIIFWHLERFSCLKTYWWQDMTRNVRFSIFWNWVSGYRDIDFFLLFQQLIYEMLRKEHVTFYDLCQWRQMNLMNKSDRIRNLLNIHQEISKSLGSLNQWQRQTVCVLSSKCNIYLNDCKYLLIVPTKHCSDKTSSQCRNFSQQSLNM